MVGKTGLAKKSWHSVLRIEFEERKRGMGNKESEMPRNECGVICFPDSAEKLNLKELFKNRMSSLGLSHNIWILR